MEEITRSNQVIPFLFIILRSPILPLVYPFPLPFPQPSFRYFTSHFPHPPISTTLFFFQTLCRPKLAHLLVGSIRISAYFSVFEFDVSYLVDSSVCLKVL
ncbi:hypothetical protein L6452_04230 [Arctium lappa]|uniref:Uncharacterized protein n=1 Tax=Arctium lappa TaxID=4217 RepID=A0ACB9FNU5_ARCLA|nr:hypothetical protein L6452_04230 [Arctium lappa]